MGVLRQIGHVFIEKADEHALLQGNSLIEEVGQYYHISII